MALQEFDASSEEQLLPLSSMSSRASSCDADRLWTCAHLFQPFIPSSASSQSELTGPKFTQVPVGLQELFRLQKSICDEHHPSFDLGSLDLVAIEDLECDFSSPFAFPLCLADSNVRDLQIGSSSCTKASEMQDPRHDLSATLRRSDQCTPVSHLLVSTPQTCREPLTHFPVSATVSPDQAGGNETDNPERGSCRKITNIAKAAQENRFASCVDSPLPCGFQDVDTASVNVAKELNSLVGDEFRQHAVSPPPPFLFDTMKELVSASCSTTSSTNEALEDDGACVCNSAKRPWSAFSSSGLLPPQNFSVPVSTPPHHSTSCHVGTSPVSVLNSEPAHFLSRNEAHLVGAGASSRAWVPNANESGSYVTSSDDLGGAVMRLNRPQPKNYEKSFCSEYPEESNQRSGVKASGLTAGYPYSTNTSFQLKNKARRYFDSDHLLSEAERPAVTDTPPPLYSAKEMLYRAAALRPVDLSSELISRPKRRNVKISKDPQSVAARHRRERISEKIRILQRLVPGGTKMDTASMLDEAVQYLKFLKVQVHAMKCMGSSIYLSPACFTLSDSSVNCDHS